MRKITYPLIAFPFCLFLMGSCATYQEVQQLMPSFNTEILELPVAKIGILQPVARSQMADFESLTKDVREINIVGDKTIAVVLEQCAIDEKEEQVQPYTSITNQELNECNETIAEEKQSEICERYLVKLTGDSIITVAETALVEVWIGEQQYEKLTKAGKAVASTDIPSKGRKYAKVTLSSYGGIVPLEITPQQNECIEIIPEGITPSFEVKASRSGVYRIKAKIQLMENENCEESSIPLDSQDLEIKVKADPQVVILSKLEELGTIVWDKFIWFFTAFVALLFSVLLFKCKAYFKRKTGYEEKE